MASLEQIRDGFKSTVESNISGIRVYDTVPEVAEAPAIVVEPDGAEFDKAMGRGHDEWNFNLYVLAPLVESRVAQDSLDSFVTGAGAKSIRQTIFQNQTLGLADGTMAFVASMSGYGGHFKMANLDHVGAILKTRVITPGTA